MAFRICGYNKSILSLDNLIDTLRASFIIIPIGDSSSLNLGLSSRRVWYSWNTPYSQEDFFLEPDISSYDKGAWI